MTDQSDSNTRECISAMVDNEASELELLRTTLALSEDANLRQTWHRYHMTSLVIRRQVPAAAQDLSEQIALAVAQESELSVEHPVDLQFDSLADPVADPVADNKTSSNSVSSSNVSSSSVFRKVAIAASVAAVTVIGVQQLQLGPERINHTTSNITTVVDAATENADYLGPQFHLPSGFALPPVSVRTVTHDSLGLDRSPQNYSDRNTHRQIQSYFQRMMVKYARPGPLTYKGTPRDQDR